VHVDVPCFKAGLGFVLGAIAPAKNVTVEVNVVPHGDGGAPDLNDPPHGFKDG
jgi:hypothetical protein